MSILSARTSGQELLQRRAVERGAGECAVVVAARDQPPAVVRLTLYICLAGLALGVERVEGKLKIVLGRLARIDGTARELADGSVHATENPRCTRDGSSRGPACGRAVSSRLGLRAADTLRDVPSRRLSRTRPLHEIAHRSWQFIVQLARTVENLTRDVCADVASPALGGVEGHHAQGMSILTG